MARRARAPCVAQILHACDVNTAVFLSLRPVIDPLWHLPLVGVSVGMWRGSKQNDSLADGCSQQSDEIRYALGQHSIGGRSAPLHLHDAWAASPPQPGHPTGHTMVPFDSMAVSSAFPSPRNTHKHAVLADPPGARLCPLPLSSAGTSLLLPLLPVRPRPPRADTAVVPITTQTALGDPRIAYCYSRRIDYVMVSPQRPCKRLFAFPLPPPSSNLPLCMRSRRCLVIAR